MTEGTPVTGAGGIVDVQTALAGRRILVIEDDWLVAQVLIDLLEAAGAVILGPIGWIDEAAVFITEHGSDIDGAVLDINLHGRKSYPLADALIARDVSFVFTTGYGPDAIDVAYRRYPRCEKPFKHAALVSALLTHGAAPPEQPQSI